MIIMCLHTTPALRRPLTVKLKKATGKWKVILAKCSPYKISDKQVVCQVQRTIGADQRKKGYRNNMPMQGVIWIIEGVFWTKHSPLCTGAK